MSVRREKFITVLVCGGRGFGNDGLAFTTLDDVDTRRHITLVVHGAATGADTLARNWARSRGKESIGYPADWKRHGRAAGPKRNARMIEEGKPDLVIAFPGGRGTADMVTQAKAAGIEVVEVS